MMYRLQPGLIVNNRAARFCGPGTPEDRGPATPEIKKMTDGDFDTPEQSIGRMDFTARLGILHDARGRAVVVAARRRDVHTR